jgi:hypothetical protein
MPYSIQKSGTGFKVYKKGTSKSFSKKPLTKKRAKAQMAAIGISEAKKKKNKK